MFGFTGSANGTSGARGKKTSVVAFGGKLISNQSKHCNLSSRFAIRSF